MATFFRDNPEVIFPILICNAILLAALCYCRLRRLRRLSRNRFSPNNEIFIPVTRQFVAEPPTSAPAPAARRATLANTGSFERYHSVIIVGNAFTETENSYNQRSSLASRGGIVCDTPNAIQTDLLDEPPPPSYFDVFPVKPDNETNSKQG